MRLPILGRRIHILALVVACVLLGVTATAEPIQIATVLGLSKSRATGEVTPVDLSANPGSVLEGTPWLPPNRSEVRAVVPFYVVFDGRQSGVLRATFDWPEDWEPPVTPLVQDQLLDVPGGVFATIFGMDFPVVYRPVPVRLTLSAPGGIIGPRDFTFSVVQPVPEPTSIVLLGSGLGVAILRRLRRTRGDTAR